jgi:hypothetical protein
VTATHARPLKRATVYSKPDVEDGDVLKINGISYRVHGVGPGSVPGSWEMMLGEIVKEPNWRADLQCPLGAEFTADRQHRLLLWRIWRPEGGRLLGFVMLNPSFADERYDDPTTTRNVERARRAGYDGIVQANLYTYRTSSPAALKADGYPGARDESTLERFAKLCRAGAIVCAWGAHAKPEDARWARNFLGNRAKLFHLGLTKDGQPRHPLYVSYGEAPRFGLQEWA